MTPYILPPAEDDLDKAVEYYSEIDSDLANRLLTEFERVVRWLPDHPELYRERPEGYRRVNLKIFPYYVAFIVRVDKLVVVAFASSSLPVDWLERLPSST